MILAVLMSMAVSVSDAETLKKRGFEVIEQIRREYYLPDSKLYCEDIQANGKKSGPCFNWGTGVMLPALNAAAKLDTKYKVWLREYADASHVYWNEKGPVPGFDVLPAPKPVDRYYDDNAWMVMALVDTYEILGDKKYLDWADQSLAYVLSGWDEKLGGGIYWRESDKASKNTCSNAPSAAACLAVAQYRRTKELVGWAQKIMVWNQKHLQDPSDALYWDSLNLAGKVDKTKWTYNTGLPIRAWAGLGKHMSVDQENLSKTIDSSIKRWFDAKTGAAKDGGKFAHLLFEGLALARPEDSGIRKKIDVALDYLHQHVRSPEGRYGDGWDKPFNPKAKKFALIDQAAAARAFLFAAANRK
jgi:hypothetical protein